MKRAALLTCALSVLMLTQISTVKGADIFVSSYEPPRSTLNGFVQIQGGTMVSNQFTLYSGDLGYIDGIRLLYDPSVTTAELLKMHVSINSEVVPLSGSPPQPGSSLISFSQQGIATPTTIMNKNFVEVTYVSDSPGFSLPTGSTPQNYWLVVTNENTDWKVGWGKTKSQDPIYNDANPSLASASINPNTLNYLNNPDGWQAIGGGGGDGNQIMLFSLTHAPEPTTYILSVVAAGVLAFTSRKPRLRYLHRRKALCDGLD